VSCLGMMGVKERRENEKKWEKIYFDPKSMTTINKKQAPKWRSEAGEAGMAIVQERGMIGVILKKKKTNNKGRRRFQLGLTFVVTRER